MYCKFMDQFIEAIDAYTEAGRQACRAMIARSALRMELRCSRVRSRLTAILLACAAMLQPNALLGDAVPVRHTEGLMHGFLVLRNLDNKPIADGQMTQDAQGDRVTAHLTFRFKDGSVYEDTTIFSQRGAFRLLSDHLIQKGPSFKQPMDTTIDASTGEVKIRYTGDKGDEQMVAERLELPSDVANGLLFTLMKDVKPDVPRT